MSLDFIISYLHFRFEIDASKNIFIHVMISTGAIDRGRYSVDAVDCRRRFRWGYQISWA